MISRRHLSTIGLCIALFTFARFTIADDTSKGNQKSPNKSQDTMSLQGKAAPDLSLKTLDGQDFKLSELKGSVVLMDYWATWCPPCRESLPHINAISQDKELTGKGLKVF